MERHGDTFLLRLGFHLRPRLLPTFTPPACGCWCQSKGRRRSVRRHWGKLMLRRDSPTHSWSKLPNWDAVVGWLWTDASYQLCHGKWNIWGMFQRALLDLKNGIRIFTVCMHSNNVLFQRYPRVISFNTSATLGLRGGLDPPVLKVDFPCDDRKLHASLSPTWPPTQNPS